MHDNWNTLGMRGTASNDVTIADVFVPDERVLADRPHGVVDPPLQVIGSIAFSIVAAVYLGVAESAAAAAIDVARGAPRGDDPSVQRLVGLMRNRLQVAGWALDGAIAVVGDDPTPSMETFAAVMAAKREVAIAGIEVCDLAMEIAGGGAFFKGSPIERRLPRHPRRQVPPAQQRGDAAARRSPRPRTRPATRSERFERAHSADRRTRSARTAA